MTPVHRIDDTDASPPSAPTGDEPVHPGTDVDRSGAADSVAGRAAVLFKALGDPRRLQLVALVRQAPGGEVCFCDLLDVFPLPQSSLSHHLRVLVTAGVLDRDRRGTWSWYRLRPDAVALLTDSLSVDGLLHQSLRREHATNTKLVARDGDCDEPVPEAR